ncbi:MAG: prolipoprotein diacylglyceryl transferase [Firmicutes bacterium]|nr:prolipoprotein diacylglyceryl transferase [Bacillota bacterium]
MHPILFRIGSFKVYSYGFMLAIAFACCTLGFIREGKRAGLPEEKLTGLVLWIMVAAMVGSRLLYVLLELPVYISDPVSIFNIRSGGLSFHGGLVFGIAIGLWYTKKHKLPQGQVADLVAPYLALGYALVRIGCLFNGCCYGQPSNVFWALPAAYADDTLRHPTQLYAFLAALLIFLLLHVRKKKIRFAGQLFWEFILLYCIYRFLVEFFREVSTHTGIFTLGQIASLLGAVLAFAVIRLWPLGRKNVG